MIIEVPFKLQIRPHLRFRLFGINAPEKFGESKQQGLDSKKYLTDRILGKEVWLKSDKPYAKDKYGRWLATIWIDGININEELVEKGLAERYMV